MPQTAPWWMLYIVAPVVAGVILLIAGGVVEDIFGSDDEPAPTPSATSPAPVGPSSPPAPEAPAPPPPPPPPVAGAPSPNANDEFAQKANEICVDTPRIGEFRKPIKGLIPRALNGDKTAERAVLRQIERFKDVLRERERRMKALRTPRGEARVTAEDFVRADSSIQQGQLAALSDIQHALRNRDGALVGLVAQLRRTDAAGGGAGARRDTLAQELGATRCAS